jgi:hypothetical protein
LGNSYKPEIYVTGLSLCSIQSTFTSAAMARRRERMKEAIEKQSLDDECRAQILGAVIRTNVKSFDHLIGEVFTHVELLGLPDRQIAAYKKSLRSIFWGWYNSHIDNEFGMVDPSRAARVDAGIEPLTTGTDGAPVYVSVSK